ncbi:MAG TPA: polysaccharide deacetylase family protein [Candidatus Paceibacterota bacterium]
MKYIKKKIKSVVVGTAYISGLARLFGSMNSQKLFCVGYHSIYDSKNKEKLWQDLYWNISLPVENFEEQLLFMKKNGHSFIHFSDLGRSDIKKLRKPTIVFFDDGFKDVLVNALPILKKYKIPATVFITTGLVEKTHFLWTLLMRRMLKGKVVKAEAEKKILEMKKLSGKEREKKIHKMRGEYGFKRNNETPVFLDWKDVKLLVDHGVEIGSHGVSHEKMTELSELELFNELSASKAMLKGKIGEKVQSVSYPYGRYNEKVENMATSCGYSYGVTTTSGWNRLEEVSKFPFRIKRVTPEPHDKLGSFAVKLYMNI